jgi:hypothetical protein
MLMCFRHWRVLPKTIQQAVWAHYRRGQCDDMKPSAKWHKAADAAIGFVAKLEGRKLSRNEAAALKKWQKSIKSMFEGKL